MTDQEKRKSGGGKLTRSETVTVRLDPKLRYLAELAARKQRRTLSSFIEWAVEDSLRQVKLYQGAGYNGDVDITVEDEARNLWDVDDVERFARLAIRYPELLDHNQQEIWKLLSDSYLLLPAQRRNTSSGALSWDWPTLEDHVFPVLRDEWPSLMMAYVNSTESERRKWVSTTRNRVSQGHVYPDSLMKANGQSQEVDDSDIPF